MNDDDDVNSLPPLHRKKIQRADIEALRGLADLQALPNQLINSNSESAKRAAGWKEKLIKFVGSHRNRIGKEIQNRFGDRDFAVTIRDILLQLAQIGEAGFESNEPPDMRALNAVLWLEKAAGSHSRTQDFLARLPTILENRQGSWRPNAVAIPRFDVPVVESNSPKVANKAGTGNRLPIVVLCPNHRSANTLATLHQLRSLNIQVDHIFVRPLVSIARLKEELRFSPGFLLKRVINELILKRFHSSSADRENSSKFKQQNGCTWKNVTEAADELNADLRYFTSFNEASCLHALQELKPGYGVFTGGGILSSQMLQTFQNGIVHAHPGILPQYKGMDVVLWAILEGNFKHVGSTCQLMSPKLDAGVLLSNSLIDIYQYDSLQTIRTAIGSDKIDLVCNTLRSLIDKKILPAKSPQVGGELYYLMHPKLANIAAEYARKFLETAKSGFEN